MEELQMNGAPTTSSLSWHNTAQFLGALNNNVLKLLIIFFHIGSRGRDRAGAVTAGVGAAFVLTAVSFRALPDFLLRFIALVTMRLLYRIRIIGGENLPVQGPALLIPNHVTWVDALLLTATSRRRIRFVMERGIYNTPVLRGLFRLLGVIPVSASDGRKDMAEFIRRARAALDEGYLVCIFAEGALTRNGMLGEFRGGFERIVKDSSHPIIPVYIGGAWGSILSYAHGRLLSRPPALAPYHVSILFGKALPAGSSAVEVRQQVAELSCDYFDSRKGSRRPLVHYFIQAARQNWGRRAVADSSGTSLSYGRTLAGALALAGKLKGLVGEAEHVGVLLPPSVGGALANLALALLGRIPVNLNYSAAEASLRSAQAQCGITSVVTSRAFLEKLPGLARLEGMLFLEDLQPEISRWDKLAALVKARLYPAALLGSCEGFHPDRSATVIFSSGSTGEPKGVMLSHHNIMSNVEALRMVFRVNLNDNVCSALPFFHSLGFTGTLWFPLVSGFSAAYHPNPMDGEKIAQVVREHRRPSCWRRRPSFWPTCAGPRRRISLRCAWWSPERKSSRGSWPIPSRKSSASAPWRGTAPLSSRRSSP
jgi:acyl-[acyl-carrier-protein]-phospholipid O-acyltransferase / long-chain-fatty-acid--[acyl-carrier-protein] ligase